MKTRSTMETRSSTHGDIIEIGKKPKTLDDINGQYTGLIRISREKIHELINIRYANRSKSYDNKSFKQMYMTGFLVLIDLTGADRLTSNTDG